MYPSLEFLGVKIFTFGMIMACTWLLFFILLHRFSLKRAIIRPIFTDIIAFTLSLFFFSRIFHIAGDWLDEKFILMELIDGNILEFLRLFFIPQNYLFSLSGAVFGFFLVFIIKTHSRKEDRAKYIDIILPAFLYSALLGYFGAFLGGQLYGIPFSSPISVTYDHIDSIVKDRAPLFPLAIFYMIMVGGILFGIEKFAKGKRLPDGFLGYLSLGIYSLMIFLGEFLNGERKDIFYDYFSLGQNQLGAIVGLIFAILGLLRIIRKGL